MRLLVVHSHFRPGGVRRVIELALPALTRHLLPRVDEVVLVGGEAPDGTWWNALATQLAPVPLRIVADPALGYTAEQRAARPARLRRLRTVLNTLLDAPPGRPSLVWLHNPGLARNPDVTRELLRLCPPRGIPLVFHHHDWWFDNRWARWPELRHAGYRGLSSIARTVLADHAFVRHAAINQADAGVLTRHFPGHSAWLPNPAPRTAAVPTKKVTAARRWLAKSLGSRAPVWLLPARFLRRKNVAEALLLTRWLRPDAWLVTTGGPSSADERPYADTLVAAARRHRWPVRFAALASDGKAPGIAELLAAAEVLLLPSLSEGFGLPYVEAAAANRPLVARTLPNVAPDLARFGFRLPQCYDEVWIDPGLFDLDAERARQEARFERWRQNLPRACRPWLGTPALLHSRPPGSPVPFSRLTLPAQLEILAVPPESSWPRCLAWNPSLAAWRRAAAQRALAATPWPSSADRWLGADAYARRLTRLLRLRPAAPSAQDADRSSQTELLRARLASENLYPLLWDSEP